MTEAPNDNDDDELSKYKFKLFSNRSFGEPKKKKKQYHAWETFKKKFPKTGDPIFFFLKHFIKIDEDKKERWREGERKRERKEGREEEREGGREREFTKVMLYFSLLY